MNIKNTVGHASEKIGRRVLGLPQNIQRGIVKEFHRPRERGKGTRVYGCLRVETVQYNTQNFVNLQAAMHFR